MLNMTEWLDYIKTSLGHPVVKIFSTDDMLMKHINTAIKKVTPYCNCVDIFTVHSKVTEVKDRKMYAIIRVTALGGNYPVGEASTSYDTLIMKNVYTGNMSGFGTSGINAALYNFYSSEMSATLCAVGFRLVDNTIYIDGDTPPYEVEAITDRSVVNMSPDYCAWTEEYSLALTKQTEGEIRSKVQIAGSPITTNGSELKSEGMSERKELEAKLGAQMSLYFCTR